jgi:hypothetical protein
LEVRRRPEVRQLGSHRFPRHACALDLLRQRRSHGDPRHRGAWVTRCTGTLLDEPALVLYRDGETRAWHDLPTDWAESFRAGTREFIDALRADRQPAQDAADAAETLRLAIAAHVAACEHREVALTEIGPTTRATLPTA